MGYEELRRNLQWLRGEDGVVEPSDFDTLERNVADCELCGSEIVDALEAIWWRVSRWRLRLTRSVMCSHRSAAFWGFS
jgi:hypothetical protein